MMMSLKSKDALTLMMMSLNYITLERTSNLIRLLVRSVWSKNSTTVVHFIINQFAARVNSLRAFASPILGAPVVSLLRSAIHTDPSGRRPLRTDTISL